MVTRSRLYARVRPSCRSWSRGADVPIAVRGTVKARLTQVVASPAGFEGRAWVREVVEALRAGGRFLGDCREGRIVLVPYGEQVFTAAEEIVRLAFRRARPVMVRSLDPAVGQLGKLRATQRVPRLPAQRGGLLNQVE
jgi:hypothetical protein